MLVAAAAYATWRWLDREPAPVVPPTPSAPAPETPPSGSSPAVTDRGNKPAPAPKPGAEPARVKYPDGSTMPALNGVTTDLVVTWGTRPFTKIIGTEDGPGGWKWYVHENGTRSTTVMLESGGVLRATPIVADPTTALPTGPGSGQAPGTGPKK